MFALSLVVTCLACRVFAAPITPSRTVQKREPHPPVLTLPTPGTELYVMVNSDWNYAPQYFQFPLIMTDGEALFPYARAMFQNSSGTYQAGDNIPVYNSWTYEAIVKTTLSIIAPGDYSLLVQEGPDSTGEWHTAVSINLSVYSEICGTNATCCWSCY